MRSTVCLGRAAARSCTAASPPSTSRSCTAASLPSTSRSCTASSSSLSALPHRCLTLLVRAPAPDGATLAVTYTNDAGAIDAWIADAASRTRVFGLDCEWRSDGPRGGAAAPASTLQLAGAGDAVLVAHLSRLPHPGGPRGLAPLPRALAALLQDARAEAVGAAVAGDVRLLSTARGLPSAAIVPRDLAALAAGRGLRGRGLAAVCRELFGWPPAWKRSRVARSDWDALPLSQSQVRYAALDAWASRAAHVALEAMPHVAAPYCALDAGPDDGLPLGSVGEGGTLAASVADVGGAIPPGPRRRDDPGAGAVVLS